MRRASSLPRLVAADRWGNELVPDYPPISPEELERLKARIEELVTKVAKRLR